MAANDDCIHYRKQDRVCRRGTGKDTPWEVVRRFYCVKGKAKVGGCPDDCHFLNQNNVFSI